MSLLLLLQSAESASVSTSVTGLELNSAIGSINKLGNAVEVVVGVESQVQTGLIQAEGVQNGIHENLNGLELLATAAQITAIGESFTIVSVSGIELLSSITHVLATVSVVSSVNSIEKSTNIEPILATGEANNSVSGIDLSAFISEISEYSSANINLTGIFATVQTGEPQAEGVQNGIHENLNGLELISSSGSLNVLLSANYALNGQEISANYGDILAFAGSSIDGSVNLDGVESNTQFGDISASGLTDHNIFVGGGSEVYNDITQNGRIRINGQSIKSYHGRVLPLGEIVNNANIRINSVLSFSESQDLQATGILDISEEEILLLLVA